MNFKRIFTAIIALVLVFCLLVNVSPVKAEASVIMDIIGIGINGSLMIFGKPTQDLQVIPFSLVPPIL